MITRETAADIWHAYREIETAEKLLEELEKRRKEDWNHQKDSPTLKDAFGQRRHFQLGIPSGENAHRLYDVPPELAESVIRAHIASKKTKLVEAMERARIELNTTTLPTE